MMSTQLFDGYDEETFRALAAGLFDGDGCASGHKDGARIDIPQAARERSILDFISEKFGGNVRDVNLRKNRAPSVVWYASGDAARAFARFVEPFVIKSRKRRELRLLLAGERGFGDAIKAGRKDADDVINLEEVAQTMTPGQIDAHAAGFFFADGSACIQSGTKTCAKVTFSQKDPAILEFFKAHFGCGNIPESKKVGGTRNFETYGDNARSIAARIAPLLPIGSGKRQILEAIQTVTLENWEEVCALAESLNGNKPSSISRKKKAKGCVSAHKYNGELVGYYARFLRTRKGFVSTKNSPEHNKRLAEECLAEWVRENAEHIDRANAA